jgi:integrase/DNA-directed RNA polymerase subunit RPC12/RpoP
MGDFICPFCDSTAIYNSNIRFGRQQYKCIGCNKFVLSHYTIDIAKKETRGFVCPYCESREIHKSGCQGEKKRYQCWDCLKTIVEYCSFKDLREKEVKSFCFEDDIWDTRSLIPSLDETEITTRLDFTTVQMEWFRILVKKYIKQEIISGSTFGSVRKRLGLLREFSLYLEDKKINNIDRINRQIVLNFISSQQSSNRTVVNKLSFLRCFFDTGNQQRWFTVSEHLIRVEDYPSYKRGTSNDIPICVLEQIEENLYKLPDPIARMWMVSFFCAMRVSELQLCSLDCLKQDSRGQWIITFWRKKNKDYHTLPITRHGAEIIQQQQEYIKQQFNNNFNYLFCDYVKVSKKYVDQRIFEPVSRVASYDLLSNCINCLIKSENIRDENNELWHFKTHQLRDTRLTYLFETGHEFALISKWAGHKQLRVTQKYVHVKDHMLRKETAKIQASLVNIKGEPVNSKDLPETLQKNPNAHTLAIPNDQTNTPIYGYCGLPLNHDCPHWKACYTCPSFIARRELLPDYMRVRNQLREKQARAEQNGETARVDQFKQQADSLDVVIASFEEAVT